MATIDLVEATLGMDKFIVLARAIDKVAEQMRMVSASIDDAVETLFVEDLASRFGVTTETMRKQICARMGATVVFRVGKRWVIRKQKYLDYLIELENQVEG